MNFQKMKFYSFSYLWKYNPFDHDNGRTLNDENKYTTA